MFYATYEFKTTKFIIRDINPKTYVKEHQSDYKDIKVKIILRSRKMEKLIKVTSLIGIIIQSF